MIEDLSFAGPSICVVGNINRDVKLQNVPALPRLFEDGETSVASVVETIGGGGANSACAAAALGAKVRFLGKVGGDSLGDRLATALQRHGVRPFLARASACASGTSVALGWASGHRHFLSCLAINESLSFEDLDLGGLDGCDHLLRADVWFSRAMLEGGNKRLFAEARRRRLVTSLDINFDPCWSAGDSSEVARRKRQLLDVLGLVDLAHGNVRELCEFTTSPDLETALGRLLECGVKAVVVHLGKEGAGYCAGGKVITEPPDLAARHVNSTGTGDVLSMCMILLHHRTDLSVEQKLRLSNRVVRRFIEGELTLIPTI
jgi:sugar/nucleoside kinase (ribokinase family)